MPDSQTVSDRILQLSIELDEKSAKAVQKQVTGLRSDLRSMTADVKKLDVTTSGLSNSMGKLSARAVEERNNFLKGTQAAKEQITVLERLRKAKAQVSSGGGKGLGGGDIGKVVSAVGASTNLAGIDSGIAQLGGIAQQATPLLQGLGASAAQVAVAVPLAGAALIAVSIAAQKFTEDMEANRKRLDNAVDSQKAYYTAVYTGTTESIKLGLKELEVKQAVAQAVRRDIQAGQDQLKQFGILQGLAEQFTGLKDQAKAADDELNQTQAQIDALTEALKSDAVAARDAAAAHEKLTEQARDNARNVQAASKEIERVQDQAAKDEAAILERAADQRIAIAKRIAEQEAQALLNLQRNLAEDRIQLGQQQADTRLNYQREEAKAARDHYRALLKIRKDAENNEFELALNRDFAGIARARRETDQRLAEEQDRYVEERQQRLTALKQQLQDNQKAYIREREQKLRQYQQQLADLRAQQVREIRANDEAARVDLERLRAKLTAELAMKQDALTKLLALEREYLDRRLAMNGQAVGGTEPINTTQPHEQKHPDTGGFARGGYMRPYQTGEVNEAGRESFTTGGRTVWLPNARGYFTPTQGGTVNPAGTGGGINISLQVTGSDYSAIRRKVHADVDAKLTEAFEMLTD